jgi:uncharacterized protein YecT (DUF1311 family)
MGTSAYLVMNVRKKRFLFGDQRRWFESSNSLKVLKTHRFMKWLQALLILVVSVQCSIGQTQSEMNAGAQAEYAKAESEMNRVYSKILTEYKDDITFIEKLKISQDLWLKFRDAELEMKFPAEDKYEYYGSVYPMCAAYYLKALSETRIKTLQGWLTPISSDDACSGSMH